MTESDFSGQKCMLIIFKRHSRQSNFETVDGFPSFSWMYSKLTSFVLSIFANTQLNFP